MNSRNKGKRGELEWRDQIIAAGKERGKEWEARRGQQFSGNPDSPDVITNLPYHFEVKRVQALNISKAMQQAKLECGNKPPVVAHRKNGEPWMVTLLAPDFFNLIKQCQIKQQNT